MIQYEIIETTVINAGKMIAELQSSTHIEYFKEIDDPVTESDSLAEEMIYNLIHSLYPEHGFISEEKGAFNTDREYIWILDPIDGTKHYSKNSFLYSISLALQKNHEIIYGVVFIPTLEYLYSAHIGQGSELNKKKISCSSDNPLDKAIICIEIPNRHSSDENLQWAIQKLELLMHSVGRIRIIGVGSIGLCMCADGQFDGYINMDSNTKIHDIAAGKIIVSEAGGLYSTLNDAIVAGPPKIHDQLVYLMET